MKVGDMIIWETPGHRLAGLVLETASDDFTGSKALVLWQDNKVQWVASGCCEVINESR
jgi:hypothetical protein